MLLKAKVLTSETPQPNISGTYRSRRHIIKQNGNTIIQVERKHLEEKENNTYCEVSLSGPMYLISIHLSL